MKEYKKLEKELNVTEAIFPYVIKIAKHSGEKEFFQRIMKNRYSKDELIKMYKDWNNKNYKLGNIIRNLLGVNNIFAITKNMKVELYDISAHDIKDVSTKVVFNKDTKEYVLQVEDYQGEFLNEKDSE